MEKYAKLLKGLEKCAGPECCKDGCPYYNTTTGGMTCRARLLLDANIAITNEQSRAEEAEAQLQDATEELDEERFTNSNLEGEKDKLQAEAEWARNELEKVVEGRRSVEAHRDAIERDREDITRERNKLREELATVNNQYRQMTNDVSDILQHRNKLIEENKALIEARDALVRKASDLKSKNDELRYECDMTVTRCQVLQNEINALVQKTDRASVSDDALKSEYKRGYLDAMEYCFRELCKRAGGGCRHD